MKKVSEPTIGRLSLYLRLLMEMGEAGVDTASSEELAERSGTTAAQVRKDLSLFGSFGKRGRGYQVSELLETLESILGLDQAWSVALVGAGKIGRALLGYADLERRAHGLLVRLEPQRLRHGPATQVKALKVMMVWVSLMPLMVWTCSFTKRPISDSLATANCASRSYVPDTEWT